MKTLISTLCLFVLSFISFNCQKEVSYQTGAHNPGGANNLQTAPITASLQGNILDESNQPAAGVMVTSGAKTATTDAKGYFRINDAALDENASVVIAEKPGYFKGYRSFRATSGTNQVVIKLIKKSLVGTINAGAGGEAALVNGSRIKLPANGVVVAAGGASFSGTINVYSAYIDPSASDIPNTIPGSLMANDKNGKRVSLASYGMIAVELQSQAGERLQIASGNTATLTVAIPLRRQATAPASISLWYLDEQLGIWKEEGVATKSGTSYVGQVKHFSFWNYDYSFPAISLSMTLKTASGAPLIDALVGIERSVDTGYYSAYGWTDSLGQVSGLVPSGEALVLSVLNNCGAAVYSQNIGPYDDNTDLGSITVSSSTPYLNTIKGKLLNCNNQVVSNGYAIIYYDNMVRYANTNSDGDFEMTVTTCTSSPASCDIVGVDETTQQQGTSVNVVLTSPLTDAGNITACGTSSAQFLNYTLDGVSNLISAAAQDSMIAFSYPNGSSDMTWVNGNHTPASTISFSFPGASTGIFPLSTLSANGFYSNYNLGIDITLTSYAQNPGEFYEGSFSGQFTDSLGTGVHNIDCTFRMRK